MSLPMIVPLKWYLSCFLPHFKHSNYLSTNLSSNSPSGYVKPSNTYFEFIFSSYLFQTFRVVALYFPTFVSQCFSSFRLHNIIQDFVLSTSSILLFFYIFFFIFCVFLALISYSYGQQTLSQGGNLSHIFGDHTRYSSLGLFNLDDLYLKCFYYEEAHVQSFLFYSLGSSCQGRAPHRPQAFQDTLLLTLVRAKWQETMSLFGSCFQELLFIFEKKNY